MSSYNFLVNKSDLSDTRLEPVNVPAAGPGEILLRVDRFALTANNITYGVAGDLIGYWQFFPAQEGWGRIPVWGIATVTKSSVDGVEKGSRYYGYYPMSGHLLAAPGKITDKGFTDQATHRQGLPAVYNHYALMNEALGFPIQQDNQQMIYRPLFTTSFVLDDYFSDQGFFGAEQIILSSASSKTAFGTAFMLQGRAPNIIGMTSKRNQAFVEGLSLYDKVFSYEELSSIDPSLTTAYIDFSGNRSLLSEVHHRFGQQLVNSCGVGITHWAARAGEDPKSLPGARPTMFFAPSQIQKRHGEWGPVLFQSKLDKAWQSFLRDVDQWVRIVESKTPDQLGGVFETVLNGAPPDTAFVLRARSAD